MNMGKISESIEYNKTKDKKYRLFCAVCKYDTNHLVLQSVDTDGSEIVGHGHDGIPDTIDWSDNYQIVQCQGCDTISFRHQNWFSEAQEYWGPDDYHDGTSSYLYPSRSKGTLINKDFYNVPRIIRRIYRETIDCFNSESYILCAAGLRAIVEGICADQNISDGPVEIKNADGSKKVERKSNLMGKIFGLCEKGILTKKNSEILHEHRYLGNEAVHELSQPSEAEIKLAIEIIEHTLESLYEIPEKAEELRTRKSRRQKKS
jgi:hypothetical protein